MTYLSVSQAASKLNARPRDISDLFYRRRLRDDLCPIVGGRRLIREDYLDMLASVLRQHGYCIGPCSMVDKEVNHG